MKKNWRKLLERHPGTLEEIDNCVAEGRTRSAAIWRKFRGVGLHTLEELRKLGVVAPEPLDDLRDTLSTRTWNILNWAGCRDIKDVRWLAKQGAFRKGCARNYGEGAHEEIRSLFPELVGPFNQKASTLEQLMQQRLHPEPVPPPVGLSELIAASLE